MARTTATVSFQAIELKGSLLPGSLLEQVARLQAPMQKEADYGQAKGERLRERIDAAWVRLKEIWEEYKDLRKRAAQSVSGLHASMRILREVLGWPDLQPCSGWQHGDAHFPITHRAFDGAVPLIVRGIAADQLDKGSSQFGQEGRRRSPHSCLQECLNADDNANWGLLLTGDRLRLLHDNPSLVKPAYLAVDLELLVEGELFDEFAVLWLLLHPSRFRHPQTGSCVLDTWKEQAQEAGERVLGQLRNGVQQALEALGNGLLQHQENELLRNQLASGALSGQELHRQLLRLVYRFLFLFTAEDRDLLFPRTLGQEDPRRRIYREGYSIGRLRELAIRRSASEGPYGDLWQTQKLVFLQLRQSSSPLGLPGLGGLFAERQCRALEQCKLANRFLLRAIRAIGWFQAGDTLTRVNYRDLNTEELGSVYEGLLELHPQLERAGGSWQLSYGGGAGSDRKTTGSYYTPDQLVQLLIVSALLPVIADRLSKATTPEEKEEALLAIRVLDPACGSGHFLLAAARRLALELARIRAGDEEPSEELRQECLRDVVAHCIYGVDKNPMAVELCKVALWIEAIEPGKPLSFLDAHIQCGDSLVGVFDPIVLEQGIPDEAYKPLTGDNKTVCTSLKKDNATYRKASKGSSGGLQGSFNLSGTQPSRQSQNRLQEIEAMPEDSLTESTAKQEAYTSWLQEAGSDPEQLAADLYTAAFFLPKTAETRACVPTTEHLLKLQLGKPMEDEALIKAVIQASRDFRFFHWHLRFGEVMEKGGFDCVLGNPPWDRIKLYEKEFFSARRPLIASAKTTAEREELIEALRLTDKDLFHDYQVKLRETDAVIEWIRSKIRFPLSSSGELNTYTVFLENALRIARYDGRSGLVVPTGFATDKSSNKLFLECIRTSSLISLIDFENRAGLFEDVHRSYRFSLVTLGRINSEPIFSFFLTTPKDLATPDRLFSISANDMRLVNPGTPSCPTFRSVHDKNLTLSIYDKSTRRTLAGETTPSEEWAYKTFEFFHMSKDSKYFKTFDESTTSKYIDNLRSPMPRVLAGSEYVPLYESKLIHQFDARWASFNHATKEVSEARIAFKQDPNFVTTPRYWVKQSQVSRRLQDQGWNHQWYIAWRDVTNATNERTAISALIPCGGAGHNLGVLLPIGIKTPKEALLLLSNLNTIVLDYVCRQKVGGSHLTVFILNQLPFIKPGDYSLSARDFIVQRALRLCFSCIQMQTIAEEFEAAILPLTAEESLIIRAELDAYYTHLYGLTRDELRYILDPADLMGPDYPSETFRVLKTNELRQFGEYRTQRLVLEAWDRLFGRH